MMVWIIFPENCTIISNYGSPLYEQFNRRYHDSRKINNMLLLYRKSLALGIGYNIEAGWSTCDVITQGYLIQYTSENNFHRKVRVHEIFENGTSTIIIYKSVLKYC